jgi:TonB-dependent SusC/RagA subfamily outer membrane receptor
MSHFATLRFVKAGAALVLATVASASCASTSGAGDNANVAANEASDEVQIGYGSQERAEVTGAVVSVVVADLGREITSFEDLFQGMAGVTVRRLASGGISIRIRGSSSLSSDAEPLYVINGVPIRAPPGQALMGVNPREVTRIDVLKDAGATSIYGSRGANGVILIFTEREDADPQP